VHLSLRYENGQTGEMLDLACYWVSAEIVYIFRAIAKSDYNISISLGI
jgi:hypothetical protein